MWGREESLNGGVNADLQAMSRRNFYNALVVVIDCWVVGGQLISALECVIKVKSREKRY